MRVEKTFHLAGSIVIFNSLFRNTSKATGEAVENLQGIDCYFLDADFLGCAGLGGRLAVFSDFWPSINYFMSSGS